MGFEEYLKQCTEQIRCKAMRPVIEKELRNHLEEQKEAYLADGLEVDKAEEKAVRDMGDPVETGTGLDRVHRPRMDFKTLGLILLLAAAGIVVQFMLADQGMTQGGFLRFVRNTGLGILVMFFACFVDYTVIGKHPRLLWCVCLGLAVVVSRLTPRMNGQRNIVWLVMLFVPAFAGIVFFYRSQRLPGAGKVLAWLAVSMLVLEWLSDLTLTGELLLGLGGLLLLFFAVAKGWYGIKRRWALAIPALLAVMTVPLVLCMLAANGFRAMRLRAWLNPSADVDGVGYLPNLISQEIGQIRFTMQRMTALADPLFWKQNSEDYTLLLLMRLYGWIVAAVILLLLAALTALLVYRLFRQKNRLGMLVGTGCIWVVLGMASVHVLMNFGLLPATACSLPFISMNGKQGLALYWLMGMLLSVFRTTTTLPEPEAKKDVFGWRLVLVRDASRR